MSHEVGHVLGLTHNFYGSSLCETEQLRDAVFLHRHGYGSSIMDYMRMNYAVQPEDGVDMSDRIPRSGDTVIFPDWRLKKFRKNCLFG